MNAADIDRVSELLRGGSDESNENIVKQVFGDLNLFLTLCELMAMADNYNRQTFGLLLARLAYEKGLKDAAL